VIVKAERGWLMSGQKGRKWTSEELYILSRMYGAYSYREIAARLGRTARSVRWKAKELRLHEMTSSDLMRLYPKRAVTVRVNREGG
jgi:hypothetical protein